MHATCRDPRNRKSVHHLLDLPGAAERLKLFAADLTVPGSFLHAMAGCSCVIHTASPYALECPPGQVGLAFTVVHASVQMQWSAEGQCAVPAQAVEHTAGRPCSMPSHTAQQLVGIIRMLAVQSMCVGGLSRCWQLEGPPHATSPYCCCCMTPCSVSPSQAGTQGSNLAAVQYVHTSCMHALKTFRSTDVSSTMRAATICLPPLLLLCAGGGAADQASSDGHRECADMCERHTFCAARRCHIINSSSLHRRH